MAKISHTDIIIMVGDLNGHSGQRKEVFDEAQVAYVYGEEQKGRESFGVLSE